MIYFFCNNCIPYTKLTSILNNIVIKNKRNYVIKDIISTFDRRLFPNVLNKT